MISSFEALWCHRENRGGVDWEGHDHGPAEVVFLVRVNFLMPNP